MDAWLILEDGTVFHGKSVGAARDAISELVFNTSMTSYVETLTDPSYAGQMVCMTYPLMGNYGVNPADMESGRIWAEGFVARDVCVARGDSRRAIPLGDWLADHDIPGIYDIDTRALTRRLREHGAMNALITTRSGFDLQAELPRIKAYKVGKVVERVTCAERSEIPGDGLHIALMDYGAKGNIARSLARRGCRVTIWPAQTPAETVLAEAPDGILLSNGPGDPKECGPMIAEVKKMYDSGVPMFAICLGHQLMALATGANTERLRYGHRGGNHPVKDLATGHVYVTSQNHGYAVDAASLDPAVAEPAWTQVNDHTNEGLRYLQRNIFTVQFHPEASPGPQDTSFLFDRFLQMVRDSKA